MAFSPDSRYLATVRPDFPGTGSLVHILAPATGRRVLPIPFRHEFLVERVAFSKDGRLLVTASNHRKGGDPIGIGKAYLWNLKDGLMILSPLEHRGAVTQVAISPDAEGKYILTASMDRTARVWKIDGEPVTPPLRHGGPVLQANFSPNGEYLVTTSEGTARVWETATGDPVTPLLQHPWTITQAFFSADGSQLVTSGVSAAAKAGEVRFCDLRPDHESLTSIGRKARLLAGRRIDAAGGFVPLDVTTLANEFKKLKSQ
jgi:WD40 repeat protein